MAVLFEWFDALATAMVRVLRPPKLRERAQSRGEEIANGISHGVGLVAASAAGPFLIASALRSGSTARLIGCSVYAVTLVLMYASSTIYHALPRGRGKYVMRICDHSAIFLLIAGTYTPFTLGVLRGPWGWTLLVVTWVFAIAGVVLTTISRVRYPTLSTVIYLAMGWLILTAIEPLRERMAPWGLFWLVAGGFAYTVGIPFFASKRLRYGHLVWHVLVIIGSACHFIDVWLYSS